MAPNSLIVAESETKFLNHLVIPDQNMINRSC